MEDRTRSTTPHAGTSVGAQPPLSALDNPAGQLLVLTQEEHVAVANDAEQADLLCVDIRIGCDASGAIAPALGRLMLSLDAARLHGLLVTGIDTDHLRITAEQEGGPIDIDQVNFLLATLRVAPAAGVDGADLHVGIVTTDAAGHTERESIPVEQIATTMDLPTYQASTFSEFGSFETQAWPLLDHD
jgi:hypothetical protein